MLSITATGCASLDPANVHRRVQVDIINGVQDSRKSGLFERLTGQRFYAAYNALPEYKVPANCTIA